VLLQPRIFIFKNQQKRRRFHPYKSTSLAYGDVGLRILGVLKLTGRQILKLKTFLKKATKKPLITRRRV